MQAGTPQFSFPVPGRALKAILAVLFAIWLVFALGGWTGAGGPTFALLAGNQQAISDGQVWRLVTAMLLHVPSGSVGHILWTLVGLYFLGSSLEQSWGSSRFLRFAIAAGVLSYTSQYLISLALPEPIVARMVPPLFFGAIPIVHAIAIAWACSFKGRTVQLAFVLPISSTTLILIVVGLGLLSLIAQEVPPSGHIANFAGMGFGWLLGGGTPSPLRRILLKYRLSHLERQVNQEQRQRKQRTQRSSLKVIPGGKNNDDDHPDKRFLN